MSARRLRMAGVLAVWFMPLLCPGPTRAQTNALPDDQPKEQDDELAKKLIRGSEEESSGVMGQIMELMDRSAERMGREFDPGPSTRAVQRSILDKLDEAITASRRRKGKSRASSRSVGEQRASVKPAKSDKGSTTPTTDAKGEAESVTKGQASGTQGQPPVREVRRSWGHLPFRDRDEILQGIDEDYVERFRALIEDYYRALADDDDKE